MAAKADKSAPVILVIDDEESICFAFGQFFTKRGMAVETAATAARGLELCRKLTPDVVFLDVCLPDRNGLDVLDEIRGICPGAKVIVITAFGSLEVVTKAIAGKAFDYLVKPLDLKRAGEVAELALASRQVTDGAVSGTGTGNAGASVLVGSSAVMQDVYKRIGLVAQTVSNVLIQGETGTGKELVARAIHEHSSRKAEPFVAVNCGALPEALVESELFGHVKGTFTGAVADKPGRFEAADGGTLFLDEIGELPLAAQVKLLRFLDSHTVERLGSVASISLDVRIIAATNRDLRAEVDAGRFRADLFYRIGVIQIQLPPLRERTGDILPLVHEFMRRLTPPGAPVPNLDAAAGRLLERYAWPGNVRELRNAVEHALVVSGGGPVMPAHLPAFVTTDGSAAGKIGGEALANYVAQVMAGTGQPAQAADSKAEILPAAVVELERALIQAALEETNGNQSAAADRLGLHRNSLRRKISELGIGDGAE